MDKEGQDGQETEDVHVNQTKLFMPGSVDRRRMVEDLLPGLDTPPLEEDGNTFEVEAVVGHWIRPQGRGKCAKYEYHVQYKGYGPEENQYVVPEAMNCPELIEAYWKELLELGYKRSHPRWRKTQEVYIEEVREWAKQGRGVLSASARQR